LLPDLPAAFELSQKIYGNDYPSLITFITGPSRTGDIERILVLGAHGPRSLTAFLLPDENDFPGVALYVFSPKNLTSQIAREIFAL